MSEWVTHTLTHSHICDKEIEKNPSDCCFGFALELTHLLYVFYKAVALSHSPHRHTSVQWNQLYRRDHHLRTLCLNDLNIWCWLKKVSSILIGNWHNRFLISVARSGTFVLFAISAIHVVLLKPENHSKEPKSSSVLRHTVPVPPQSDVVCTVFSLML